MSIFDTTAPTDFNSFGSPLNPANTNAGWSVNPNYLTPAFSAPYRPPYHGGGWGGFNPNPTLFSSLYGVSPLNVRGTPYGIGTTEQNSAYWDAIGSKPNDFLTAMSQRVAVPLLAYGGAMAMSRAWQLPIGTSPAFAASRAWSTMWGGSENATMSGFANMGARFGGGATESMLTGMFGKGVMQNAAARAAVGLGGGIGAGVLGIGGPLLLAQGGIAAANNMIFDNYINAREGQNLLRRGFSGVTFNSGVGSPVTGQGLSRQAAGTMGGQLAAFGAKDEVFTGREINTLTSMSAQMGLLDNVSSDQIVGRMKSITKQVKMVMSLADTPDFKEAVNIIAKLNSAGVSPGNASSVYASMGNFASQTGISTSRLFNTMGMQGQYLFQSNGMTPYVGQLVAGGAAAGFSSAYRNGLISNELMARMGGVEGAVQSSLTGQLNAAQTVYNQVKAFNTYTTGAGGQGVIQNITNFGRAFANDPISAYGAYLRTGRANASKMLEDEGPLATYNQMRDIANLYVGNKSLSQNQMWSFLMPMMGNDPNAVQAFVTQMGTYQRPEAVSQMRAGSKSARAKMMRDYLEQTEQTYVMSSSLIQTPLRGIRSARGGIGTMMGNAMSDVGGAIDYLEGKITGINVGDMRRLSGIGMNEEEDEFRAPVINSGRMDRGGDIANLIKAAKQGDKTARGALAGNEYDIETAARNGIIDRKYIDKDSIDALKHRIGSLPLETVRSIKGEALFDLETGIDSGMFKGMDRAEAYGMYNTARDLYSAGDLRNVTGEDKEKLEAFMTSSHTDIRSVRKAIDKAVIEGANLGVDYNVKGARQPGESLEEYLKRGNARVRGRIPNTHAYTDVEQAMLFAKGEGAQNRNDNIQEEMVRKLMSEGHIDLAAGYKMKSAVDKFDESVDKLVAGIKGREATSSSSSSGGSRWSPSREMIDASAGIIGPDRSH